MCIDVDKLLSVWQDRAPMHSNAFLSRGRCHDAQPAILHVAQLADANREHWAAADVLKAGGLVQRTLQGNRMRLASDVRELVVRSELQAGRADKARTLGKHCKFTTATRQCGWSRAN